MCQVVTDSLGNAILGNRTSAIKSIEEMARLRVNISLLGTANTKACVCVCVCVFVCVCRPPRAGAEISVGVQLSIGITKCVGIPDR